MKKKKRRDSYLGLHFDFHAEPQKCQKHILGDNLHEEDIRVICRELRPDFIQIDCKGHPGFTSYPSRLGNAMPAFSQDPMALWRRVTAEEGVALYAHYSGVEDIKYVRENPAEAVKMADGTFSTLATSTFGHYDERLLIPQLMEIASYGLDGVWIDGECWATRVDFSEEAIAAFLEKTGMNIRQDLPIATDHPYHFLYRDFCREQFRKHMKRYCEAVHARYPDFQIASNWAYSEEMPESTESAAVDYLSGDCAPQNSIEAISFSAKILAPQNMPWDLMSWGFRALGDAWDHHANKHPVQLMQEAAAVLMHGGSYQIYTMQRRDASPKMNCVMQLKPVMEFCRQRQPFCQGQSCIPQAVLFNSTADHYRALSYMKDNSYLFGNATTYDSVKGWVRLLIYAGHSFDIREEHNLFPHIGEHPIIIVPEAQTYYDQDAVEVLLNYAVCGGNLVIAGLKAAEQFAQHLDEAVLGEWDNSHIANLSIDSNFWSFFPRPIRSVRGGSAVVYGSYKEDGETEKFPVASLFHYGKGRIMLIGADLGAGSISHLSVTARKIAEALFELYTPPARISGSHCCEVYVAKKENRMLVHLLNIAGDHSNCTVDSFDEIPPLHNLRLSLSCAPAKAVWQPGNLPLTIVPCRGGGFTVSLPPLDIHAIVELHLSENLEP